ncbi:MAG: glycosyltransferase family 1 protein [Acidobacteriota bacterium]
MRRELKVAVFTDSYDQVNGVSNAFRQLVRYCRQAGRSLDLYTASHHEPSVESMGPVRVWRQKAVLQIPYYSDMAWDLATPNFSLVRRVLDEDYDLIHVATPGSMGLNGLYAAHKAGLPLVGSYHTALPEYVRPRVEQFARKWHLPAWLGRTAEDAIWRYVDWFYGRCQIVLAPSSETIRSLQQRFGKPVELFTRGVDTECFHPRFRRSGSRTRVLYVGRISVEKNLEWLVRALGDRHDVEIVIVGDGPYRAQLQAQLPQALFPGFMRGTELSRVYASSDVFLFPSQTDTFGNVVLEAMSSGLAVIVSDRMGPKELVRQGETGFIAGTEQEFSDYLNLLLTDAPLRQRISCRAREYALTRNWQAVFEDLFRHYVRVAGGTGPFAQPVLPAVRQPAVR